MAGNFKRFDGRYCVVDTIDKVRLGTVVVDEQSETLSVFTGVQGRPPIINFDEVDSIVLASKFKAVAA